MRGVVKWFSDPKGYGFITPDEGSQEIFIHHSDIDTQMFRSLQDGQRVEFEIAEGRKGPRALKLKPIDAQD